MSEDARIKMWCSACRQADTDPRHHILQADGSLQIMHMDCCRDSGSCADGSCNLVLTASGEKRSTALIEYIEENM
jgi:uncharacterized protein YuzB (UPF0349 family)